MLKQLVTFAVAAVWMLGLPGCSKQVEYNPKKTTELRKLEEELATLKKQASQLQNDLDAAKKEIEKSQQAKKEAEATIKTLQQENDGLKEQIKKLSQGGEQVAQLQKNLDTAKAEIEKAKGERDTAKQEIEKAQRANGELAARIKAMERENVVVKPPRRPVSGAIENLSGDWEITYRDTVYRAKLEALGANSYRLGPQNLAFSGIYQFDGNNLSLIGENTRDPNMAWSLKKPGAFEMVSGRYIGALMRKRASTGPSQPQ
jgi:outer membrane murein-binding lipoprotein Lpp